MSIALAELFEAADEAALIAELDSVATTVGWTVITANTYPTGASWYLSTGEDGLRWIVTGVVKNAGRSIRALAGSDFDNGFGIGLLSPLAAGYVNQDPFALNATAPFVASDPFNGGTDDHAVVQTSSSAWPERDLASTYTGRISVTKDAIVATVDYESGGVAAQGVLYLGRVESDARELYKHARARVVSSTLVGGTVYRIVLDDNINPALKDTGAGGATYAADPAQQWVFFQPRIVDGTGTNATGFGMTERVQIVPSSLTLTGGGATQFDVDIAAGTKLFTAGSRYDTGGVDLTQDIVSVLAEPTAVMCAGATGGATTFALDQTMLVCWDAFGGQRGTAGNCLDAYPVNMKSVNAEPTSAPDKLSGRTAWYPIYVLTYDKETGKIAQANNEGQKRVGTLMPQLIMVANSGAGDNARFTVNSDVNRRYRIMTRAGGVGLAPPGAFFHTDCCYAVGPGF